MKVLISRNELLDAVSAVSSIIPARSTQPVLANILISTGEDKLTLTGTDREQSLFINMPAEVEEPGSIAVGAKMLSDVIRAMDDADIRLETDDLHLNLLQGRHRIKLPGVSPQDFPEAEIVSAPTMVFTLPTSSLVEYLDLTTYAMSTYAARPSLAGLLCQFFPEELRMVATDGHKLALLKKPHTFELEEKLELFIPERAATRINSLISKTVADEVEIAAGNGAAQFSADNFRFQTKLISEKFPDYERVIPTDNDKIMIADKEELIKCVKLMTIIANKLTSQIKFTLSRGSLELFAQDLDTGSEGTDVISVDYDGEPLEIGFNGKMLLNLLEHIPAENVRFAMLNPTTACIVEPLPQPEEYKYLSLIMPIRI